MLKCKKCGAKIISKEGYLMRICGHLSGFQMDEVLDDTTTLFLGSMKKREFIKKYGEILKEVK